MQFLIDTEIFGADDLEWQAIIRKIERVRLGNQDKPLVALDLICALSLNTLRDSIFCTVYLSETEDGFYWELLVLEDGRYMLRHVAIAVPDESQVSNIYALGVYMFDSILKFYRKEYKLTEETTMWLYSGYEAEEE